MAYFANGTEGTYLDEQCDDCLHGISDDVCCPVYLCQIHFNYDQLKNAQLEECLHYLVGKQDHKCKIKIAIESCKLLNNPPDNSISDLEAWDRERGKG